MVCLNETFLDESIDDRQLRLSGYTLVSRRDRRDGRTGGGILCFAAERLAENIVLCEHSDVDERTWHIVHSDIGPILCGVWYRPPCGGETASIASCEEEWRRLSGSYVASILVGDFNVHHRRWLRYSSCVSVEGTALFRFSMASGMKQRVKMPTRDDYLLDLVLSDIDPLQVQVRSKIADHNVVTANFDFGVPDAVSVDRMVFEYNKADWEGIVNDICEFDWSPLDSLDVDPAERFFHFNVMSILRRHVPEKQISEKKSKHPWVNEVCLAAIEAKNASIGTEAFAAAAADCSAVLFGEYLAHVQRMKDKLKQEKRGSKGWWRVANEIMEKDGKATTIPALQHSGEWIHEAGAKADVFAETFSSKFVLPACETNQFSTAWPTRSWSGFVVVRGRHVERTLLDLDVDSGTGPDGLATRVLRRCARALRLPLAKLIRRIVTQGIWPTAWTEHWLLPLYKRKSPSNATNYRAINLTAQVSKVAERFLGQFFMPTLDRHFGEAQFAYRKEHGARDALLLYALSWIAAFNDGCKVGVYCSDVQGAFDKVDAELLLRKLSSPNLNQQVLQVLRSWLRGRRGFVIVNGKQSTPMELRNMVFQGTVWGPCLWNIFFSDCICALTVGGFEAIIYADDCNAFRRYAKQCPNETVFDDLAECQQNLHAWGRANSVTFDAGKEEKLILSTTDGVGGPAKLLGVEFDNKLVMGTAAHKCARKAAFKSKALIRCRRFYSTNDLIALYKSHVLSFIEYRTPGLHFASSSILVEIDDGQSRFLKEIEVSEESAFMVFNLAPLQVRRDIAILGIIHRASLQQGPPQLWKFFRRSGDAESGRTRRELRHNRQVAEWPSSRNLDVMRRSALGSIRVYNLLPQDIVDQPSVKEFQRALTNLVQGRVVARDSRWKVVLSPRHPLFLYHPLVYVERR